MGQIHSRNSTVDLLRGLAMLMVVLGHTMTGCTLHAEDTLLYNLIWSLQMPLFMLISGYVTRYSGEIGNGKALLHVLLKHLRAYLWPWLLWTFLVRGLMFGNRDLLNLKWLVYHMDTGYWFLFSLWNISLVFDISRYFSNRIKKNANMLQSMILTGLFYGLGMVLLLAIAVKMGLPFLGLKLTLYYMVFFFLGVIFGKVQKIMDSDISIYISETICSIIYLILLTRFDLFRIEDNIRGIGIRFISSLTGCIAFAGIVGLLAGGMSRVSDRLTWIGRHTLEIYVIHSLCLCLLRSEPLPECAAVSGFLLTAVNFVLTLSVTSLAAWLLGRNSISAAVLFGRKPEKHKVMV